MKATLQPQSLEVTIKVERDKNVGESSTTVDHVNNAEGERNASNPSIPLGTPTTFPDDIVDLCSDEDVENHDTDTEGNKTSENSQYQLVLYVPSVNEAGNGKDAPGGPGPISCLSPPKKPHPFSDRTPRVLPSVGLFAVQCASCFKWRLVPTKEKYEEIREHLSARPFFCDTAREWCPDVSCDDHPDITQDGSRIWAIDKPNIPQPPTGWKRLLRIRGEGSVRFADVYYVAPSGKSLRSMLDIQRYLDKHPEYMTEEVSLSRFSFLIPKPIQKNYVRKRPVRPAFHNDAGDPGTQQYLPPSEGVRQPARITWVSTDGDTDLQPSSPALAYNYHLEAPPSNPKSSRPAKRPRTPSQRRYADDLVPNRNDASVEEPLHL
ncbi:methyl-CpG-binding domain-containing protein 2-like [Salvia hispanica]|uniref:methyl-CpG-binding domain-containing protein 2-like n=1 Tax=Salvia hispanica TaxID=49212 RepID=UPI002009C54D|nr:methyl-CpG-binding domain-containing protein 2-like [Salvia hispanica]XP_047946390.1 methyl-CpG-binding domain-containing protein 2-like [Salvia hispanica]XP_047946391.1 methyl-CpG-binding domain-containing protein 2-like [Salvia hispanica]